MILSKNPKGKTEANEVKTLMLKNQFVSSKVIIDNWSLKKVEVVTIKTSKGEYTHPIDMNAEMAKRFEALERQCNITDGGNHLSQTRSKQLQGMYNRFKSMPLDDVKRHKSYLRKELSKDSCSRWGSSALQADELYVIETLLKIK